MGQKGDHSGTIKVPSFLHSVQEGLVWRRERFQNTLSLICILPSSLKERDIENNTFNSYANK